MLTAILEISASTCALLLRMNILLKVTGFSYAMFSNQSFLFSALLYSIPASGFLKVSHVMGGFQKSIRGNGAFNSITIENNSGIDEI